MPFHIESSRIDMTRTLSGRLYTRLQDIIGLDTTAGLIIAVGGDRGPGIIIMIMAITRMEAHTMCDKSIIPDMSRGQC